MISRPPCHRLRFRQGDKEYIGSRRRTAFGAPRGIAGLSVSIVAAVGLRVRLVISRHGGERRSRSSPLTSWSMGLWFVHAVVRRLRDDDSTLGVPGYDSCACGRDLPDALRPATSSEPRPRRCGCSWRRPRRRRARRAAGGTWSTWDSSSGARPSCPTRCPVALTSVCVRRGSRSMWVLAGGVLEAADGHVLRHLGAARSRRRGRRDLPQDPPVRRGAARPAADPGIDHDRARVTSSSPSAIERGPARAVDLLRRAVPRAVPRADGAGRRGAVRAGAVPAHDGHATTGTRCCGLGRSRTSASSWRPRSGGRSATRRGATLLRTLARGRPVGAGAGPRRPRKATACGSPTWTWTRCGTLRRSFPVLQHRRLASPADAPAARGGYELDDDPIAVDVDVVHAFLTGLVLGRGPHPGDRRAARPAPPRVIGLYRDGATVGFCRVESDEVTYWPAARCLRASPAPRAGLGVELVREAVEPARTPICRGNCARAMPRSLYERFGFGPPDVERQMTRPGSPGPEASRAGSARLR